MEHYETNLEAIALELADAPRRTPESPGADELLLDATGLDEETPAVAALRPEVERGGRAGLEREAALSMAIEESWRVLLTEIVDFDLAFRQLLRLGEDLAAGRVRLRAVVDVAANFESADDEGGAEGAEPSGQDAAVRATIAAFAQLGRLRDSYLRAAKGSAGSKGAQATARRLELIRAIEALSIHPGQLRRIDVGLKQVVDAVAHAEQALRADLRATGHRIDRRPGSARAWRIAVGPILPPEGPQTERADRARQTLAVLRQIEREAGVPVAKIRERAEAIRRAHVGLETAKTEMVRANLHLVRGIASKYRHSGLDPTDLLQEGSIGLMRAVERYDHRRGFRFSTYAHWWIRQAITRSIADHGRTVRVPVHMNEQVAKLRRVSTWLSGRLGRSATIEEVAQAAGVSPEKAASVLRHQQATVSLDAPLNGDSEASLLDLIPDPNATDPTARAEEAELNQLMESALAGLPAREQQVLRLRFGIGASQLDSLEEIGGVLGVTRERVRQIESKGLQRLLRRQRSLKLTSFQLDDSAQAAAR